MGSGLLDHRAFPLEPGLDDAVDHDGLSGERGGETPCGALVLSRSKTAHERQQHPDQTEVAEFGEGIEDPIGGFGAAEAVEPAVDHRIEPIDGRWRRGGVAPDDRCAGFGRGREGGVGRSHGERC